MEVDEGPQYTWLYGLYGHASSVTAVSFSYDGSMVATCGSDHLVQIWETRTGRVLHTLRGHTDGVNDLCWTRDSRYVASASDDRSVRLWDAHEVRV